MDVFTFATEIFKSFNLSAILLYSVILSCVLFISVDKFISPDSNSDILFFSLDILLCLNKFFHHHNS